MGQELARRQRRITTSGAGINTVVGGNGPPLLLLHGHPQTMVCWHKVAPALAGHFTVVMLSPIEFEQQYKAKAEGVSKTRDGSDLCHRLTSHGSNRDPPPICDNVG